jgi:hypothetical protein
LEEELEGRLDINGSRSFRITALQGLKGILISLHVKLGFGITFRYDEFS